MPGIAYALSGVQNHASADLRNRETTMHPGRLLTLSFLSLLVLGCAAGPVDSTTAGSGELTFLHLNDTYRVGTVEDGKRGGFSRVITIIRRLQDEGREVRLLHGGDFLYPSLESQLWDGRQMIDAFNFMHALAPMQVVPGNHEFDRRTPDALVDAIEASAFDWLAGNVRLNTGRADIDQRLLSHRIETINGRKIGVFALTLHPDDGGNRRDYTEFDSDYLQRAEESILALEAEGADLVIGLTHLHIEDDVRIAALKARHPTFLFLVGGHEHEPEHAPGSAATAEVMKGASNARTIWRIDLSFDDKDRPDISTQSIELDSNVPLDAIYEEQIAGPWRARLLDTVPFLPGRIGEAAVPFDAREVTLRNRESNWGNFVVDQMRLAFGEPAADFAVLNSGTLRIDDYIAGDITFEDVARTFGFSSFLRYLTVSGDEFRNTMEAGFRGEGPSKGYFPQVSGFRVCVDRRRPSGQRIVQLQVPDNGGWADLNGESDYLVVAPDYLLRGGDGYTFPAYRERSRPGSELKYLVFDAIVRAQSEGRKVGQPVDPENPRIAFVEAAEATCFSR